MSCELYVYCPCILELNVDLPNWGVTAFDDWESFKKAVDNNPPTAVLTTEFIDGVPLVYLAMDWSPSEKLKAARMGAIGMVTLPIDIKELQRVILDFCKSTTRQKSYQLMVVSQCTDRVNFLERYFASRGAELSLHSDIVSALHDFDENQETYSTHYHVTCSNNKRVNKYSNYDAVIVDNCIKCEYSAFDLIHVIRQTPLSPHVPIILLADSLTTQERNRAMQLDVVVLPRYGSMDNFMFALNCAVNRHTKSFNDFRQYSYQYMQAS